MALCDEMPRNFDQTRMNNIIWVRKAAGIDTRVCKSRLNPRIAGNRDAAIRLRDDHKSRITRRIVRKDARRRICRPVIDAIGNPVR